MPKSINMGKLSLVQLSSLCVAQMNACTAHHAGPTSRKPIAPSTENSATTPITPNLEQSTALGAHSVDSTGASAVDASPTGHMVARNALSATRTAGDLAIQPNNATAIEIMKAAAGKIAGTFRYCIDVTGAVDSVTMLKSIGFPAYDQTLMSTIRGTWRFHPFMVRGQPAPVCSTTTFVYEPAAPVVVNIKLFKRIAGVAQIAPSNAIAVAIGKSLISRLVGTFEFCINSQGRISRIAVVKSTGVPAYDLTIVKTMGETWVYSPLLVDGKPTPACSSVTFIYATGRPNGPWPQ